MTPPSGRSGPGTKRIRSATVASGWSSRWIAPAIVSARLWGAILVAMPTAMPEAPLTSSWGNAAGRTSGCVNWLS